MAVYTVLGGYYHSDYTEHTCCMLILIRYSDCTLDVCPYAIAMGCGVMAKDLTYHLFLSPLYSWNDPLL